MIERHTLPSGALLVVVSDEEHWLDERPQVVLSAQVVPPESERYAYVDWAVNPAVTSVSALILGQLLEVLGDLRENMWALDRLHFGER
jgi:hypothetical protein